MTAAIPRWHLYGMTQDSCTGRRIRDGMQRTPSEPDLRGAAENGRKQGWRSTLKWLAMTALRCHPVPKGRHRCPPSIRLFACLAAAWCCLGCYGSTAFGGDGDDGEGRLDRIAEDSSLDDAETAVDEASVDGFEITTDGVDDGCGSPTPEVCNELDDDCDGVTDDGLWCAVQPRQYSWAFDDVWGSSASDVWVAGAAEIDSGGRGVILRWNGESWVDDAPDGWASFSAVGGAGPDDVWVAGMRWLSPPDREDGLLHRDPTGWSDPWSVGTDASVGALWAVAADDVWAAGCREVGGLVSRLPGIWRWDGSGWQQLSLPDGLDGTCLHAIFATGPRDAWAVGSGSGEGIILRWDGSGWSVGHRTASPRLTGVWGSSADDIWVSGINGTLLHWDGRGWTASTDTLPDFIEAIWGFSTNDVWIGAYTDGVGSTLNHWDGDIWSAFVPDEMATPYAIWGASPHEVWAAGDEGLVWRWRE
jgi:hypothetical protein